MSTSRNICTASKCKPLISLFIALAIAYYTWDYHGSSINYSCDVSMLHTAEWNGDSEEYSGIWGNIYGNGDINSLWVIWFTGTNMWPTLYTHLLRKYISILSSINMPPR